MYMIFAAVVRIVPCMPAFVERSGEHMGNGPRQHRVGAGLSCGMDSKLRAQRARQCHAIAQPRTAATDVTRVHLAPGPWPLTL